MGRIRILRVAAVVCLAFVPAAGAVAIAQSAPEYEVIDLTALLGGDEGSAYDVNDLGEIVMTLEDADGFNGYLWSEAGGPQLLTDPGWYYLIPQAINNSGTVTGLGYSIDPWGLRGFVRTPGGVVSRLNSPLTEPYITSMAFGLNEAGWAVGGGPSAASWTAFLWWPPGYNTIAILSGYAHYGMARDVNDYVQGNGEPAPVVVGSQSLSGVQSSAVCWGCDGLLTAFDLGELVPGNDHHANGVNDLNHIVGESCSDLDCKAFLWTASDEMTELAGLPGSTSSAAQYINEADWVAGSSEVEGSDRAVIWNPAGQVTELPDLPDGLSSGAQAINEGGWVVGWTRFCIEELERECVEEVDHATLWRPSASPPQTPAELILELAGDVEALEAAGVLNKGQANSLLAKLGAAYKKIEQGQPRVAVNQLEAFINQVEAMLLSGRLTPEQAEPLIAMAQQAIDGLIDDESS